MIDSHCHLDHEPLFNDLENVLKRSKEVGIEKLLTICTTFESFVKIKQLVKKDDIIYGTYGIHPHEAKNDKVTKKLIIDEINANETLTLSWSSEGVSDCLAGMYDNDNSNYFYSVWNIDEWSGSKDSSGEQEFLVPYGGDFTFGLRIALFTCRKCKCKNTNESEMIIEKYFGFVHLKN